MTTPGIDAESVQERMRNLLENASKLSKDTTRSLASLTEETQALAEEATEIDQTDVSPNTNG